MKKIFVFLLLSIATVSCYEDYIKDFDYSSIYFAFQTDVRTLIVGEGMQIKVGVALGGVSQNAINRNVTFEVKNSLVTPAILTAMKAGVSYISSSVTGVTTLLPLPPTYYTLSNSSKMVIEPGQHSGYIIFKPDSAVFLADAATLKAGYVLPLNILTAEADSVIEPKRYTVVGIKYENMLFGNYYHGGVTTVKDVSGNTVSTVTYKTTIPVPDNQTWKLTTVAPDALTINGYSNLTTAKAEMRIALSGGNITISSVTGGAKVIQPDGTSKFNQAKLLQDRKIILSYKYANADGTTSFAQDTLTFRNRLQDGVNIWQDEDPSHYKK
jgi:hypothetical protein